MKDQVYHKNEIAPINYVTSRIAGFLRECPVAFEVLGVKPGELFSRNYF